MWRLSDDGPIDLMHDVKSQKEDTSIPSKSTPLDIATPGNPIVPVVAKQKKMEVHSLFVSEKQSSFPAFFDEGEMSQVPSIQRKAKRLMTHPKFDVLVASTIAINSMCLGVQTDYPDWPSWQILEAIFCLLFSMELIVRIIALRCRFFQQIGGLFDGLLVGFSIVDLIVSNVAMGGKDTLMLRILRLSRIARILRLIKLYQPLYLLIESLQKSVSIVMWVMLLLLVTLYAFAIFIARTVGQNEVFDGSEVQEHFISVPRSMLALFTVLTFEGWYWDFAQPICNEMPAMAIFFILFLCATSFSVLNVFTAMIVEATMGNARDLKCEVTAYEHLKRMKHVKKLKDLFNKMDTNGDGELQIEELMVMLEDEEVNKALRDVGIPKTETLSFFELLDLDKSSSLTIQEFVDGCIRMSGEVLMARDITMSQYTLQRDLRKVQDELLQAVQANEKRWETFDTRVEYLNSKIVDLTNEVNFNANHSPDQSVSQGPNPEEECLEQFCALLEQAFDKAKQRKTMKGGLTSDKMVMSACATKSSTDKTDFAFARASTGDLAAGVSPAVPNKSKAPIALD
jgi:hypothetical protein